MNQTNRPTDQEATKSTQHPPALTDSERTEVTLLTQQLSDLEESTYAHIWALKCEGFQLRTHRGLQELRIAASLSAALDSALGRTIRESGHSARRAALSSRLSE
jgi:hypothetical protein